MERKEVSTNNNPDFSKRYSSSLVPKVHHDESNEKTFRVHGSFKAQVLHENKLYHKLSLKSSNG